MDHPTGTSLRIGEWSVYPMTGQISRGTETVRVEARTMRLLLCLAENAGQVVSIDDLLSQVWAGVVVTPDSVYQAVTSLRRLLGDDPKRPTYISTVPRLGYRMIASVASRMDDAAASADRAPSAKGEERAPPLESGTRPKVRSTMYALLAVGVVLIAGGLSYLLVLRGSTRSAGVATSTAQSPKSVAVLPFLDLTDGMNEEPFADGMTEELINKLSKVEGLRVRAGQRSTAGDAAKSLGAAYVLDGSVRKSGATLRVTARLVRTDDGYVVWSETYDRPVDDKLMVQDDIAGEVAKALRASIR